MFWIYFAAINIGFFLISYFINIKEQTNPIAFFFTKELTWKKKAKFFYTKYSSDPFKISVEYTLGVLLICFCGLQNTIVFGLVSFLGLLTVFMSIYSSILLFVFNRAPLFISDYNFAKVGIVLLGKKKYSVYMLILMFAILAYWGIYSSTIYITELEIEKINIIPALIIVAGLGYYNSHNYLYSAFFNRTFYSPCIHIIRNIFEGKKYEHLLSKDDSYFEQYNIYKDVKLKEKPNIVIFSVESYGSIIHKDPELAKEILPVLREQEQILSKLGFECATAYSEAPLFGGGSWLSYSTLLYGTKINDEYMYRLLMKSCNSFLSYQPLPSYLQGEGYEHYVICPIGGRDLNAKIDWELIKKNHRTDNYISYDNLEYEGQVNSFMSLGISAPDQFNIHRAKEIIDSKGKKPYSIFFSTLNSHTPFSSPLDIISDWRDLNQKDFRYESTDDRKNTTKEKYKLAIIYQLRFIVDFISKNKDENTIYILLGDHQPPFITEKSMGSNTMMHVISSNSQFMQVFLELDFQRGMTSDESKMTTIKHEGIYSLFMKALNKAFGEDRKQDLPYIKEGNIFEK